MFFPSCISLILPAWTGRYSSAHKASVPTLASEFGVALPSAKVKQILDPENVFKNYT